MTDWDDAERRVERAQELFEQRRWHEALAELKAAIHINPYNGSWLFNVGLTLDELGRWDEAIDAYRQALEIDPNDLQSMNHLGVDLHRVGRYDDALRTFEKLEQVDATFEPSYCNRIITFTELGDHEKAEEMFYLARLYKEHCPHCYYNIGCSLHDRKQYDRAIYCWQKTLDLDDGHPQVRIRIAEALWDKGELEQARQYYLKGLRQDPGDTDTLLDLGELLVDMHRLDEAGEKFRRVIELAPEDPAGHYCLGRWMVRRGQYDAAFASFEQVLRLDPTYPGAHLRLAELAHRRKDRRLARRHLRAEILLRPVDQQTLVDLGNLLMDVGQVRTSIACLKRLVAAHPDHVSGWQNLAVAQFLRNLINDGIDSSRRALELDPHNVSVAYNLALGLERAGRYDEAIDLVRDAMARAPQDASLQRLEMRLRLLRAKDAVVRGVRKLAFWK